MEFTRTQQAAQTEKQSKWDLIEAIALDAVDNGVDISSVESQVGAYKACAAAGNEHADPTIRSLCVVAKFDYESSAGQRRTWRKYGWSVVAEVAKAGWSQDAASAFLAGRQRSQREVRAEIEKKARQGSRRPSFPQDPNEFWHKWITHLDRELARAAEAIDHYGATDDLDPHSALAVLIYERITENKIDAELRDLIEAETTR
jgi:hypothetical protein